MDSREPPPPQPPQLTTQPPHLPPHHRNPHLISHYPSSIINHTTNPNNNSMPNPNSAPSGFPFNSVGPPPPRPQPKPSPDGGFDGSSPPSSGMGFSIDPGKKKRGRPRKYTPEGNIGLALSPTAVSSSGGAASAGYGDSGGGVGNPGGGGASSEAPAKRRGRPPGSGKKQLDALGGGGGIGFTPHVITVKAGEDIAAKVMSFSQQGPRSICILSANGAVSNVSLCQAATSSGTVSYEGVFEIISLSGSYLTADDNSGPKTAGALSVSLAGADGRVLGGRVAGSLIAATAVQVIAGSFVAEGKKSNSHISNSKSGPSPLPVPGPQILNFGAPLTASTPSQGASSDTSDDGGSSPVNRGAGIYGNSGQPIQGVQMYHHLWPGQNPQ